MDGDGKNIRVIREMQVLYVGDARNVRKRILTNHGRGNIESSILRKHIATELGFKFKSELRVRGSYRIRILDEDREKGEKEISEFLKRGKWRVILVDTYEEAHELQWYIIERLNPPLNRRTRTGVGSDVTNCDRVFRQLMDSSQLGLDDIARLKEGPGVYVYYNIWAQE